jgi:hypothetical protein
VEELEKRERQVEDLEIRVATCDSDLAHVQLECEWAKDAKKRAEDALAQRRTRKVSSDASRLGDVWERCREPLTNHCSCGRSC